MMYTNISSNSNEIDDDSSSNDSEIDGSSSTSNECVICLESIHKHSDLTFECNHKLHKKCFNVYFMYNYDPEENCVLCPICRKNIFFDQTLLNNSLNDDDNTIFNSFRKYRITQFLIIFVYVIFIIYYMYTFLHSK